MKLLSILSLVSFFAIISTRAHDVAFQERDEYSGLEGRDFVDELASRELHEPIDTRDYVNELAVRQLHAYARREALFEGISTRDLVDELEHRLSRRSNKIKSQPVPRGNSNSKPPPPYVCPYCGAKYNTKEEAKECSMFCKAK
ncbi:hypothetical protein H0H87_005748 [Tephrocybe sp. NHM501043]|nr:hypothetical protein H0H87_005748 [Tephrocybe sp. NHM501043]